MSIFGSHRSIVGDPQRHPPKKPHRPECCDEGRKSQADDENSIVNSTHRSSGQRNSDRSDRSPSGIYRKGCTDSRQGDHRSHRQVDPGGDDHPGHSDCGQTDHHGMGRHYLPSLESHRLTWVQNPEDQNHRQHSEKGRQGGKPVAWNGELHAASSPPTAQTIKECSSHFSTSRGSPRTPRCIT